ncbi:glutamine--fructose-6-phosphate aminotransferase [Methanobrevibacter curvatus]|uniref:Glutamine--fructose-6-phosphate aminotransferase n=2 Tax=Methanobrevibacter curvatus TaxID=49547 RepID=A0A166A8E5_9EURY|nr:glutamine--fructose-6-phosphate aminotransferase [Methanobrevibacter curvatus]
MYDEILEQSQAIKRTFQNEKEKLDQLSSEISEFQKIYLIGCGSSLSTVYTIKSALNMATNLDVDVFTGYEYFYNKKLDDKNAIAIFTSQSGETADTLASIRKSKENNILTIAVVNEKNSSMYKEADFSILTHAGHEKAILGTKTYVTQLSVLYYLLFSASDYDKKEELLADLNRIPDIIEDLVKNTEEENKKLALEFKDEEIFYCMGSGPNYGLAYKLSMTMFMEGALKHACPLYSGEFRHGLIERVEKGVSIIFLEAGYDGDLLTDRSIEFSNNLDTKNIIFSLKDYGDINNLLAPLLLVIPLEWFIYYLSHFNNEDPGSTRHIGKVRY